MRKKLLAVLVTLALLSMSWTGCQAVMPNWKDDALGRFIYCGPKWNADQWESYNNLVKLAKLEDDPYKVKEAAVSTGAFLKSCWPEEFKR